MKRQHFSIGSQTHTENYIYYELWPKASCFECWIIILTSKSTAIPILVDSLLTGILIKRDGRWLFFYLIFLFRLKRTLRLICFPPKSQNLPPCLTTFRSPRVIRHLTKEIWYINVSERN